MANIIARSHSPQAAASPLSPPVTSADHDNNSINEKAPTHSAEATDTPGKSAKMPSPFAGPRGQSPAGTPAVDLLSLARSPPAPFEATLSPPLGQFVINSSLQAAALLAAVAFGVFAIRSVRMAQTANLYAAQALNQSIIANGLALVSICLSGINTTDEFARSCSEILGRAHVFLSSAATLFPASTPSASPSASSAASSFTVSSASAPSQSSSLTRSPLFPQTPPTAPAGEPSVPNRKTSSSRHSIAIAVAVPVGVLLLTLLSILLCIVRRRRRSANHGGGPASGTSAMVDISFSAAQLTVPLARRTRDAFDTLFLNSRISARQAR